MELRTLERFFDFIMIAVAVFFGSFTVLGVLGFLPSDIQVELNTHPLFAVSALAESDSQSSGELAPIKYTPNGEKEYPVSIIISKVGIDAEVSDPKTADPAVLDADLGVGAVRYPTGNSDGALNDGSNVFIFGHSSYLKFVHNPAYRTFDGLQNLQKGDEIEVDGVQNAYFYAVASVSMLKDSDAVVNVGGNQHLLILSTCDVFGEKEDRYVVTATFEKSLSISKSGK